MKKMFILFILLFLGSGCSSFSESSYDTLLSEGLSSSINIYNTFRSGYKYYLPKGLKKIGHEGSNEVFSYEDSIFYMYVDRVSYFNKTKKDYVVKPDVYFSKELLKDDKFGYTEIKKLENEKYFVEIMYNYAKIEVIVTEKDIKESVAYAMAILESVTYNDTVLGSLMGDNILSSNELEFNIFETAKTESNYLEIVEQYDQYKDHEDVFDMDFIK